MQIRAWVHVRTCVYMCVGTKMYLQITTDTTTLIKVTFCKFLMTFFIAIWML